MRKLIFNAQTTLDNRTARADGSFWEPFPWGDTEQAVANEIYARCDTWVMTRPVFEVIVPWWDMVASGQVPSDVPTVSDVDRAFASTLAASEKIAISRTMTAESGYRVLSDDLDQELRQLKAEPGSDIILSAGPLTIGPLLAEPGLVDELLLVIHPAVIGDGPRLFDDNDLALRLIEATPFAAGAILTRYELVAR